jgi:6-phosphogluconolactonase
MSDPIVVENIELLTRMINKEVEILLEKKDRIVFGMPGGRSIKALLPYLKELPWKKIHVFMVDERLVPIDDPESNFFLLKDALFNGLISEGIMPEKNLHPFIMKDQEGFGLQAYTDELKKFGGFDIIFLGVGEDCHIAGLFPHHTVEVKKEGYFSFHDSPKPPKDRMSCSTEMLLKAKLGIFLFMGEGKKPAYKKLIEDGPVSECPSRIAYKMNSIIYKDW